jgi:hypothetical protein
MYIFVRVNPPIITVFKQIGLFKVAALQIWFSGNLSFIEEYDYDG